MPTPALPTPAAGATTARRLLVLDDILAPDRNSFGAIRLAMAIAVLLSHSFLFHGGTRSADPLLAWTGHTLGEHAVQVFFFLSGILIAQSFDKSRSLLQFAAARALRILPALIVVVLLTAFVLGPLLTPLTLGAYLTDGRLPAYVLKTIGLVTGAAPLPGLFEALPLAGRVNMSLWTLKYEVICYLGVALLGLAGLFRVRWRVPAILLLALAVATVFIGPPKVQETQTFLETTRYFALYFFMGTLAYLVRRWLAIKPLLLLPLALLFAAAIGTRFHELAGALLIGYGTVVLASRSWGFLTPFAREHDWSYGVYIYAAPVQQALLQLAPAIDPMPLACFALAIVLPFAAASWALVEKPAIGLRRLFTVRPRRETGRRAEASGPLRFGAPRPPAAPPRSALTGYAVGARGGSQQAAGGATARYDERLARLGVSTQRLRRALRPMQPPR